MKRATLSLLLSALVAGQAVAQEHKELGRMWTFENVPLDWFEQAYGFRPTQEWLDHARMASLRFGQGCSSSFVSPRGLIMTNHHCARGDVAKASPKGEDWLRDGYFATCLENEPPLKGLTVQQLVKMVNVTDRMNEGLDADGVDRPAKLAENKRAILAEAAEQYPDTKPEVVELYQGGMYQLYVYKVYDDIRLVATPEIQAAKFGGDPDNFTYPRYCTDYAFVRAYENGKPVDSSKHYFKWNTSGPKEGDAVFVTGNPGSTGRLDTLAQMEYLRDVEYPMILKIIKTRLERANQAYERNPTPQLRSQILNLENGRKAYTGYRDGLLKKSVMDIKRAAEKAVREAIDAKPELAQKYASAWVEMEQLMAKKGELLSSGAQRTPEFQAVNKKEGELKKKIGEAFFAVYGTSIPPDATFTLRISDGVVKGFPMNGTLAPFITTTYGLYARHAEFGGKDPFHLNKRWLDAKSKLDLETPFNLVSTSDIIGGNSGSPMVNKDLEVVGLVFDGNIESLSNRFVYTDDVPRTVCVHPAIIIASLRTVYGCKDIADEIEGKSPGYKTWTGR